MNKIVISNWEKDYVLEVDDESYKSIQEFKRGIATTVLKITVGDEEVRVTRDEIHFIN